MNPIGKICSHESCRSSNKCVNRYGKLSCTTRKQAQQTTTTESTIEPTTTVVNNEKYLFEKSNKLKETKPTRKQMEQDIIMEETENAKLYKKIVTLQKSKRTLTEVLETENNKNAKLAEKLLDDKNHQCRICLQLFIKPTLLGCSHMFCEWCILKWLEKSNDCPQCRVRIDKFIPCLNMDSSINESMKLMPSEIRLAFRDLEVARAKEKESSLKIQTERKQLEFMRTRTRILNQLLPIFNA